jgi:hypothetical protein
LPGRTGAGLQQEFEENLTYCHQSAGKSAAEICACRRASGATAGGCMKGVIFNLLEEVVTALLQKS